MNGTRYSKLQSELTLPSPIQKITSAWFLNAQNIEVYCKRDDLIHNTISGNKWRKLLPLAEQLASQLTGGKDDTRLPCHILSFGGAYSNHLHALAYLCHRLGVRMTAIVRGDYSQSPTPMLNDLYAWGTNCHFVTKQDYKKRTDPQYIAHLKARFEAVIAIPEGGSNSDCLAGVASVVDEYQKQLPMLSHVVLPVASGGTMAGIITQHEAIRYSKHAGLCPRVIGIAALKSPQGGTADKTEDSLGYLEDCVMDLIKSRYQAVKVPWHIEHDFHHGGYAKSSLALKTFMADFTRETAINVETVYSGKCFYALYQMIKQGYFAPNSKILAIHTGGLQGGRAK